MSRVRRHPATVAARAGITTDHQHGSVIPPIHLSSTFRFERLGVKPAYDYTRSGNPTRDLLAEALAELEEGAGAVITATGMAAVTVALHLAPAGGRVVAPGDCYGGTHRLLTALAARGAFELELVDAWKPDVLRKALERPTDLLWIETPSNPLLRITDIRQAVQLGHRAGAIVLVDNTFLSPALQRPLTLGADLVLHSTTKYINGHSDVVGGALIARDPAVTEVIEWWANALGVTGSPFDAYQTLRGLRTLEPRMRCHLEGAREVVDVLTGSPAVRAVHWPGLPSHPGAEIAARQQQGAGSVISFELRGGIDSVRSFVEHLDCFTLAESLGGVESLVSHPDSMTHSAMPEAARRAAGITEGLVRLAVGIEAPDDLARDVRGALARLSSAFDPGRPERGVQIGEAEVVDDDLSRVDAVEDQPELGQVGQV